MTARGGIALLDRLHAERPGHLADLIAANLNLAQEPRAITLGSSLVFLSALSYAFYLIGSGAVIPRLGAARFTGLASMIACVFATAQFFVSNYVGPQLTDILGALAALFALVHLVVVPHPGRLLVFFPALVFGWLAERSRGALAPAVHHALCNVVLRMLQRCYV